MSGLQCGEGRFTWYHFKLPSPRVVGEECCTELDGTCLGKVPYVRDLNADHEAASPMRGAPFWLAPLLKRLCCVTMEYRPEA